MTGIAHYLAEHRFHELFLEELGWDRAAGRIELTLDGRVWDLQKVAQKRGIQVLHGQTDRPTLRNRARLRRLQQKLAGLIHEHVVIGRQYGITRERVRQRLVKVLPRLQRLLAPVLNLPMPTSYDEIREPSEAAAVPTASESAELAVVE